MKKTAIAIVTACMLLSASSAVYASAPVSEKEMHMKKMEAKKKHEMHVKKMDAKKHHKIHAKSTHPSKKHKMNAKSMHSKNLHSKSLKAKDITQMPKTGLGGASEQAE